MYAPEPSFPSQSVNEVLDAIADKVQSVTGMVAVYPYRAMKAEAPVAAAVTSIREVPATTVEGLRMAYDYIVDLLVRIGDDPAAAERTLNDTASAIWRELWGQNQPYWGDAYPYAPTDKPAAPEPLRNWRRAILYVRVIPN